MVVQHHVLLLIYLMLLFVTCYVSEPTSTRSSSHYRQFDVDQRSVTRTQHRNHGRARSHGSGRRTGGGINSGSSNCDPLYQYLFGRCGRFPFSRTSPNNPFIYRPPPRWPPQPLPPVAPPVIPSPPPVVPSPPPPPPVPTPSPPPPPPVVPSPPPPSPSPPPPLVPSPPPPDPSPPPPITLSPPPDYILPPAVPELPPDDPFQPPPSIPISFSPPPIDINPPPLVPTFSPPQANPSPIPEIPPITNPGNQFPPEFPFTSTPTVEPTLSFPGTGQSPEIIMPPPIDNISITEVQTLFPKPQSP